jgi:hypothetical protein
MAISESTEVVAVGTPTSFLQWTPVVAGAFVASAVSLILIAFGTALGMGITSSSPTWRDTSASLTIAAGLYLLVTALVSFGIGGYMAGRLRERWDPAATRDIIEFRDGTHGLVSWALAVIITGVIAATSAATVASKAVQPGTSTFAAAGEPLVAYELDKLFRGDRRPMEGEFVYRAEAARILLTAGGRQGVTADDRAYLVQLVSNRTGLSPADAERRVTTEITAAAIAVRKARRTGVILGFSTAAALLAGAAAAWYAAYNGGRHRDNVAPPNTWTWPHPG